jgi:hypothetical protein
MAGLAESRLTDKALIQRCLDPGDALGEVLFLLLFLGGYRWGRYTDARPWRVGLAVLVLGIGMVLVAAALGG